MTRADVYSLLCTVNVPVAYHHFAENSGQQPPFICFYYPYDDDFKADNANYRKIDSLIVELYTDNKDFAREGLLEAALSGAGLVWRKTEEYINTEKMYMITYTTEVLIDG